MTDAAERAREMTHSDRAWKVIQDLSETWCYGPCAYQEGCGCSDAITAALREAENAAYEKAAQVAEGGQHEMTPPDDLNEWQQGYCSGCRDSATAIRSLKAESK